VTQDRCCLFKIWHHLGLMPLFVHSGLGQGLHAAQHRQEMVGRPPDVTVGGDVARALIAFHLNLQQVSDGGERLPCPGGDFGVRCR
jgi:hypothetical protein